MAIEPQMAAADGRNLATSAKASPYTVTLDTQNPQIAALRAQLYSLGFDAPATLATVSELLIFASANYMTPTCGSS